MSNLVCNHKSVKKNQTTTKLESNLLIMSMIILTKLGDTKTCYQSIKTLTKFEEETRHWLHIFIKKKPTTVNLAKCLTAECTHDMYCPLTKAWHVFCPITLYLQAWCIHCPISIQIELVNILKFCYSFDYI